MTCACFCFTDPMCLIAAYNGINQTCVLYMERVEQGTLRVMTTDLLASVLNFENKTSGPSWLTSLNETVYGIWNTTAGQDSQASTAGFSMSNYVSGQGPAQAFDQSPYTKYVNFGVCNSTYGSNVMQCGYNTGLYLSLQRGSSVLVAFRFWTANSYPSRDPINITLEGSNTLPKALVFGSSWTLIYNGSSGLDVSPGFNSFGQIQWLSNNTIGYSSYRVIINSKRGIGNFVQYSELQLFGF